MVGNSVRSDIAPVIEIGATAAYIPSENIWIHEVMDLPSSERIIELSKINQLLEIL
jgi:putative hydrolase of the HAD superfamily